MNNRTRHFDYIIVGNGLSGLQLALAMAEDSFFADKQIALIDKEEKAINNKTWCFWEKDAGKWNHIVNASWDIAKIYSSKKTINLSLQPYQYKMLRAIDFYKDAKSRLSKKSNIRFIIDDVILVEESQNVVMVSTPSTTYSTNHVFDSRINNDFYTDSHQYINVIQHFKGWIIDTEDTLFNSTEAFTMMDYRLKDGEQTTFMYVLPISEQKALVEFTYFTLNTVEDATYDVFLKQYISEILEIKNYTITETEKGSIPMTNFPFEKYSTQQITKIGTAGGWVKGSTGYSFKHTEKKVAKVIDNLKHGVIPSSGLINKRFKFYDKVFLKVLHDENEKGEWLFERFYSKNSIQTMFRFLDEESTFWEELKIMYSLFSFTFIKAFFKTL